MQKMYIKADELEWLDNLASASKSNWKIELPPNLQGILQHLRMLNGVLQRRKAAAAKDRKLAPSYGKKYRA